MASCTTALSTHPPLTEPTICPISETAIIAPNGRGDEP